MDKNLNDLFETPTDFLTEITDKDFLNQMDGGAPAKNPQTARPPSSKPEVEINLTESQQAPPPISESQPTNINIKDLISGELAADLMNKIMPVILSIAANKFMALNVPKKQFEMSAADKNLLSPILDRCLAKLNISFENEWVALGLTLSFIYGSKVIDVANNPEFQKAKAEVSKKVKKEFNPATREELGADGIPAKFVTDKQKQDYLYRQRKKSGKMQTAYEKMGG